MSLNIITCEKDLGEYIDPHLHFKEHITNTMKKAKALSGMTLRSLNGRTSEILIPLFISLVSQACS